MSRPVNLPDHVKHSMTSKLYKDYQNFQKQHACQGFRVGHGGGLSCGHPLRNGERCDNCIAVTAKKKELQQQSIQVQKEIMEHQCPIYVRRMNELAAENEQLKKTIKENKEKTDQLSKEKLTLQQEVRMLERRLEPTPSYSAPYSPPILSERERYEQELQRAADDIGRGDSADRAQAAMLYQSIKMSQPY